MGQTAKWSCCCLISHQPEQFVLSVLEISLELLLRGGVQSSRVDFGAAPSPLKLQLGCKTLYACVVVCTRLHIFLWGLSHNIYICLQLSQMRL